MLVSREGIPLFVILTTKLHQDWPPNWFISSPLLEIFGGFCHQQTLVSFAWFICEGPSKVPQKCWFQEVAMCRLGVVGMLGDDYSIQINILMFGAFWTDLLITKELGSPKKSAPPELTACFPPHKKWVLSEYPGRSFISAFQGADVNKIDAQHVHPMQLANSTCASVDLTNDRDNSPYTTHVWYNLPTFGWFW